MSGISDMRDTTSRAHRHAGSVGGAGAKVRAHARKVEQRPGPTQSFSRLLNRSTSRLTSPPKSTFTTALRPIPSVPTTLPMPNLS